MLHLPECPTAAASSRQPSTAQALGGGCTISTSPSVSPFFSFSTQHFKHTQNQVLGILSSRADMGAASKMLFRHMTEHSHCNHTHGFLSTRTIEKTTWENYNCPIKTLPIEDRWFPGKTQALGCKLHFPCKNIPLFLLQHAHGSRPHVTSLSRLSDYRVQGQVPVMPAQEYRGSGSVPAPAVLETIPALFTWARLEFPECPSPMTAGAEHSNHAGPRAFQAWPLHITRDQPKKTACLVMLQDKQTLGCHGFCCCNPLSIPGVVISIPLVPLYPSPQPLSHR